MAQNPQIDDNLHSVQRRLIELRIEHADLDDMIDRLVLTLPLDDLALRRLKKRRLALRDQISRLELEPILRLPPEHAGRRARRAAVAAGGAGIFPLGRTRPP
jgi:hypothetical protein